MAGFRIVLPSALNFGLRVESFLVALRALPKKAKPSGSDPQPRGAVDVVCRESRLLLSLGCLTAIFFIVIHVKLLHFGICDVVCLGFPSLVCGLNIARS